MARKRYDNPDEFFKKFGARIRELRLERELTQEDMMDFDFSYRFYQRIEAGKPIHMKTVLKLADAFEMKVEDLLKGTSTT